MRINNISDDTHAQNKKKNKTQLHIIITLFYT